ncbi:MAG: outer membrane beta-barrel protein [Terracidiphilus sp.]
MTKTYCKLIPATAAACLALLSLSGAAQQSQPGGAPALTARIDPPAGAQPASGPSATSAATSTDTNRATPAANGAQPADASEISNAELKKDMQEMRAEITELKGELKSRNDADAVSSEAIKAYEQDVAALKTAVHPVASSPSMQAAAAPAAPAPPEITAETTTKSAPFPGDWTWLNSGGHNSDSPMSTKYFTPEIRFDTNYILDYNHPSDDSMGGSTEMFRSDEFQIEQASVGGDFRIQNVRGRILTMFGEFATTTIRNDASYSRGQWQLNNAYRYVSEAWGGYHWDVGHGLNADAGIFVSYIGLFSYYNFDNWAYQPSYVSSNTPWFFTGLRVQYWPTEKLKIEPWFINGWQTYGRYNSKPGLGGQILYRPKPWLDFVWNNYGVGQDDAGFPGRTRIHADYSAQIKFYDNPNKMLDKIAFTVTGDLGCEMGGGPVSFAMTGGTLNPKGASPEQGNGVSTYNGGVSCHNHKAGEPKQAFEGWMDYMRFWFHKDVFAVTLGGGQMSNPGRYLTLLPPINGATATTGSPYFTENAGDQAQMRDGTITLDYMPRQFITFRLEESYRYSNVPYWTGRGGITPYAPGNGDIHQNVGSPSDYICSGTSNAGLVDSGIGYVTSSGGPGLIAAINQCSGGAYTTVTPSNINNIWWPDLRTNQTSTILAIMVRF